MTETLTAPQTAEPQDFQPEALHQNPESIFPSSEEAFSELMERVVFTADPVFRDHELDEGTLYLQLQGVKRSDGSSWFSKQFTPPDISRVADFSTNEQQSLFQEVVDYVQNDPHVRDKLLAADGRPWVFSRAHTSAELSLREVFTIEDGSEQLDCINCTDENLSDDELAHIKSTIASVNAFTGGRLLARLGCVVFDRKERFKEGIIGGMELSGSTLSINLDKLRENVRLGTPLNKRYQEYFPNGGVDDIDVILAHELGHAVDISTTEEVESYGIRPNDQLYMGPRSVSAFQSGLGWVNHPVKGDGGYVEQDSWEFTGNDELVCPENLPTSYAAHGPREDFAETFAILALNGDRRQLQARYGLIVEHIKKMSKQGFTGPQKIQITKISKDGEIYERKGGLKKVNIRLEQGSTRR